MSHLEESSYTRSSAPGQILSIGCPSIETLILCELVSTLCLIILLIYLQVAHVEPSQLTTSVQGVVLILLSHLRQTVNSADPEQDGT